MSAVSCTEFRALLERSLVGPPRALEEHLAWHEHLLGCAECRALLEAEEALELLLQSLPQPALPHDLAERVLARLSRARNAEERRLDELLELTREPSVPAGLAGGVLAGLEGARADQRLERLLELPGAPRVPDGLAQRVLAGLAPVRRRARFRLLRGGYALATAATIVLGLAFFAWRIFGRDAEPAAPTGGSVADGPRQPALAPRVAETAPEEPAGGTEEPLPELLPAPPLVAAEPETAPVDPDPDPEPTFGEPDEELLAALDLLERWDLLMDEDVDLALSGFQPPDELLLDLFLPEEPREAEEETGDPPAGRRRG